jgi:arabinan endo-1,5-alpha-L-arabinosidase
MLCVFDAAWADEAESLDKSEVILFVGGEVYSANKAYLKTLSGAAGASWSSGDESVAVVSETGEVTAVGIGTTTIAAATANGTAACAVEVLAMPELVAPGAPLASKPPTNNSYPQNDSVHDPEIVYVASEGLYYMLCTHNRTIRSSADLITWTNRVTLTTGFSDTADAFVKQYGNYSSVGFWAPDIVYNHVTGKYHVYYSVSNTLSDGGRGFGNKCSAIGMAYLEPVSGELYSMATLNNWKDGGIVVKSYDAWRWGSIQSGSGTYKFGTYNKESAEFGPNAIDPMVFFDKSGERLFMVYGSFFEGIFIIELDPATGLPFDQGALDPEDENYAIRFNTGICVANRGGSYAFAEPVDGRRKGTQAGIEGPCVFYSEETGYYYLMASYDYLDSTYNVRIGRSKDVGGPYRDYNGFDLVAYTEENVANGLNMDTVFANDDIDTDTARFIPNPALGEYDGMLKQDTLSYDPNIGTKVLAPYQFAGGILWRATGHNCVFKAADGSWLIGSHAKSPQQRLHVRRLLWTEDGWPMASPARYAGEVAEQPIDASNVAGSVELAVFPRIVPTSGTNYAIRGVVSSLNPDGTVTSATAAYNGTWRMSEGNGIDITLGGVSYSGSVGVGWDWENWDHAEFVIAALSADDGTMLWGKGGDVASFTALTDKAALAAKIDEALAYNLAESTALSALALADAIEAAQAALNNHTATQAQIDAEIGKIDEAIEGLEPLGDAGALEALIAGAAHIDARVFSADSVAALNAALGAAEALIAAGGMSQDDLNAAYVEVEDAIDGLAADARYAEFSPLLKELQRIAKIDYRPYSTASWANLQSVVDAAWLFVAEYYDDDAESEAKYAPASGDAAAGAELADVEVAELAAAAESAEYEAEVAEAAEAAEYEAEAEAAEAAEYEAEADETLAILSSDIGSEVLDWIIKLKAAELALEPTSEAPIERAEVGGGVFALDDNSAEAVYERAGAALKFEVRGENMAQVGDVNMRLSFKTADVKNASFELPDGLAGLATIEVWEDEEGQNATESALDDYTTYSVWLHATGLHFTLPDGAPLVSVTLQLEDEPGADGLAISKQISLLLSHYDVSYYDDSWQGGLVALKADETIYPAVAAVMFTWRSRFDIDLDGSVTVADVSAVRQYLGTAKGAGWESDYIARCDLGGSGGADDLPDGVIDTKDLTLIIAKYESIIG